MAFFSDDFTADGSDDISAGDCDKQAHIVETLRDGFGGEDRIAECFGRVLFAIRSEGCGEAGEDCRSVTGGWPGGWRRISFQTEKPCS